MGKKSFQNLASNDDPNNPNTTTFDSSFLSSSEGSVVNYTQEKNFWKMVEEIVIKFPGLILLDNNC